MAQKIETCNGDFILKLSYDTDWGNSFYDVYFPTTEDECGYGEWVGEFYPNYAIDDDYDAFLDDFEAWLDENNIVNLNPTYKPQLTTEQMNKKKQEHIKEELEKLVHKRFGKESLEKKLSEIFSGEEIHIELGCEDVDYLTDWNYMFSSEQDVIGGDFDVYVLMHKNNRKGGWNGTDEFLVTEVSWEFFDRY